MSYFEIGHSQTNLSEIIIGDAGICICVFCSVAAGAVARPATAVTKVINQSSTLANNPSTYSTYLPTSSTVRLLQVEG